MFYFQRDLNNSRDITKQFKCGLKKERENERSERHFRAAINMTSVPPTRRGDRRAEGDDAQWQLGSIEQSSGGMMAQLGQEDSRSL